VTPVAANRKLGRYSIIEFDKNHPAPIDDLLSLHQELLPRSPVILLGESFMRDFYYSALVDEGLLFGSVAYLGTEPAGFCVATDDSSGFIRTGMRKRWRQLMFTMTRSIVTSPARVLPVIEALQIMQSRTDGVDHTNYGELLSLGVRPAFRSCRDESGERLSISRDLVDSALGRLRARGVSRMCAIVDADNLSAQLFYKSEGWGLVRSSVPGWRVPSVEFVWDGEPE